MNRTQLVYVPFLPVLLVSPAENACRNLMSHCKGNLAWRLYCQMPEYRFSQDWMLQSQKEKQYITVFNSINKVQWDIIYIYIYNYLFIHWCDTPDCSLFCVCNWPSSLKNIFHCSSGPVSIFICCCVTNTDCTPRFDPELVTACKMQKEHYLNVIHPIVLII